VLQTSKDQQRYASALRFRPKDFSFQSCARANLSERNEIALAERARMGAAKFGVVRQTFITPRKGERKDIETIKAPGRFAEPQAARLSHQHFYRSPLFPGNLFSVDGPLRLAEIDSRKSTHNFQTHKARVRRRAACRGAIRRDRAGHRAAALMLAFLQQKHCYSRKAVLASRQVLGCRSIH
jgi:hypothetical protein